MKKKYLSIHKSLKSKSEERREKKGKLVKKQKTREEKIKPMFASSIPAQRRLGVEEDADVIVLLNLAHALRHLHLPLGLSLFLRSFLAFARFE